MIPKPLASIGVADVTSLLTNAVPEGRHLDYKREMPGTNDDAKRELLADVSSLANAGGGDLVFGVDEENRVPTSIGGVAVADADAEKLRLFGIIRDGLDPRVASVDVAIVPGFPNGDVWVLRVPRSFRAPHMVTFKGWSKFFGRTSGGKYLLDVREIRDAFLGGEQAAGRVRSFRADRLAMIASGDTPTPLAKDRSALMVLHVVPLTPARIAGPIVGQLERHATAALVPLYSSGFNSRHNLDGYLTYSGGSTSASYAQLFRDGTIEHVTQAFGGRERDGRLYVSASFAEAQVGPALERATGFFGVAGVAPPYYVGVCWLGVRGAHASVDDLRLRDAGSGCDRDVLDLPGFTIEDAADDVTPLLRATFDAMWNAFGYPYSPLHPPPRPRA